MRGLGLIGKKLGFFETRIQRTKRRFEGSMAEPYSMVYTQYKSKGVCSMCKYYGKSGIRLKSCGINFKFGDS